MTIPTKEQTLEALAELYCERTDLAERSTELRDRIRSYIESHTGEPVAWRAPQQSETFPWAFAWNQDQLDAWRDILGIEGQPLFTSPVQPVKLECPPVRSLIEGAEIRPIDILQEVYQMFTEARDEGRSEISSKLGAHLEARVLASWKAYGSEWLSGGDK